MDFVQPVETVIPGVQGRVLAVLARTTAGLSLRSIARLADVSVAQASRVLPRLVQLGVVARRETPPASEFRLVQEHVVSRLIVELAHVRTSVLDELGRAAATMQARSVVIYGSLARGEAEADSDVDVLVVRPSEVSEDDDDWVDSLETWRLSASRLTGNQVELLDVDEADAARMLKSRRPLWIDIRREGLVIAGEPLGRLEA